MISSCARLTNFFNSFGLKPDDRVSQKRKFRDTEVSSFVNRTFGDSKAPSPNRIVQDIRFPIYNGPCRFPRLGPQVVAHSIGSFLAYRDLVSFSNTNKYLDSIGEIRERSIFSDIPIFGKKEHELYWEVEITDKFEPAKINKRALRRFLKTYFGPNPLYPTELVKDTCLIPIVVPVRVMVEGISFDYNLNLLGDIASHPRIGNAANYGFDSSDLELHGEDTPQEEACLVIVLKDVTGRNFSWEGAVQILQDLNEETGYGCEIEPEARALVAAIFAHYAVTGERAFGNDTGIEGRRAYVRTKELVRCLFGVCHMKVGNFIPGLVDLLGDSAPATLDVMPSVWFSEHTGVAVQLKIR
jgi:hypothetical protein